MTSFYKNFPARSKEEWLDLVESQLKDKKIDEVLHKTDPIEEIDYLAYGFADDNIIPSIQPGQVDFSRGGLAEDNEWINTVNVPLEDPKKMNAYALQLLMNGATGLTFNLSDFTCEELTHLVKGIGFEHISATFHYSTQEQFDWLNNLTNDKTVHITAINEGKNDFGWVKHAKNRMIKAIDVHYAGGNVTQELAYALHLGHETLYQLIKDGLTVDEAAKQIKFQFGIGNNYFFELTKFKVFRALYHTVVNAYKPKDIASTIPYVEAQTGFLNKSLKDPHNNLLRQTTEALSAVLGGVDELNIRAYNDWSTDKLEEKKKAQRLGLNIALLLKEEAYMDKVIDPAGGAYILENIYQDLYTKVWKYFQDIEKNGLHQLQEDIKKTSSKRIQLIENKESTLIGVNKFFNEEKVNTEWDITKNTPFGTPVILERDCKIER